MAELLLQTKLFIPHQTLSFVPRQRLITQMNKGLNGKLILLCAPAGFGKTTLVTTWLNTVDFPVGWISLDEGDNDVGRFFAYFVAALHSLQTDIGQTIPSLLSSPQPAPLQHLMTVLINELTAVSQPIILVLDDYHLISEEALQAAIAFFVEHAPPHVQVVITSRATPPMPLARLRARRQLLELYEADLRFTLAETAVFCNEIMRLNLTEETIAALEARTEGWIAGLQMAALSLERNANKDQFVADFAGDDRYILDYLIAEVLQQQSEEIQHFLLKTAVLDRFCADLCAAILQEDNNQSSHKILQQLEQNNLFIIPLDNRREWYRYHHLFADLLQNQLQKSHPDLILKLHRRAAQWFAQQDLMTEAIEQSLLAKAYDLAADYIDGAAHLLEQGESKTLISWLEQIPVEFIDKQPELYLWLSWAYLLTSQSQKLESCLQQLENSPSYDDPFFKTQVLVIRTQKTFRQGDTTEAAKLAEKAKYYYEQYPRFDPGLNGAVVSGLGMIYLMAGDMKAAVPVFKEAIQFVQQTDNLAGVMMLMDSLATVYHLQGELHQEEHVYLQMQQLIRSERTEDRPLLAASEIGLGRLYLEWNRLDDAKEYLQRGIEIAEKWYLGEVLRDGLIRLIHLQIAHRQWGEAEGKYQRLTQFAHSYPAEAAFWRPIELCRRQLSLANGRFHNDPTQYITVSNWIAEHNLEHADPTIFANEEKLILLARYFLYTRKFDKALRLLSQMGEQAEENGRLGRWLEIQLLSAAAQFERGEVGRAVKILQASLPFAEKQGYHRLFLNEGPVIFKLLQETAVVHPSPFVNHLLAAFAAATPENELTDPLSQREMDVLRLLPTELSTTEIGAELHVSTNTVRTHIKRIYSKLNVHSRHEAVTLARQLQLIP